MTAIDEIRTKVAKYSDLTVEEASGRITVTPRGDGAFRVGLSLVGGCPMVFFEGWHEACPDEAAALELFAIGLSDAARLRVTSRGGHAHQWTAEFRDGEVWRPNSTTGLLFFRFWRPAVVSYLQNHVLVSSKHRDPRALILPRECRP